jgi:hypothetical protein
MRAVFLPRFDFSALEDDGVFGKELERRGTVSLGQRAMIAVHNRGNGG